MKRIEDVEALISDLRPAAVSRSLQDKVAADLEMDAQWMKPSTAPISRAKSKLWWQPMTWSAIGAAAAVVAMLVMPARQVPQAESTAQSTKASAPAALDAKRMMSVSTTREVLSAEDQGIRYNARNQPEQHLKVHGVERRIWIDPRDGSQYLIEIPIEDRMVLPADFQ